ncbi:Zinc finger CCHC domain-containing protein 7 [Anthophora plagiata]
MEYNVFRDYCKAENSEDEEANHDLQSQLYSEIYYTLNDKENVDTKTNIKLETSAVDDEKLQKNANTSRTADDSFVKSSCDNNSTKMYPTTDLIDTPAFTEKDDKPDIKDICVTSAAESSKGNPNVSCAKISGHCEESHELQKPNKQLTCSNCGSNCGCIAENDVCVKEELRTEPGTVHEAPVESKAQESSDEANPNSDILKKYEFSKLFINKLYLEKYENLQRKLQKIGDEEDHVKTSGKRVSSKVEKQKVEEVTVLLSDTESDSAESILEVPIPPKPQPPVINLQDSDDSLEELCTDSEEECSFHKQKETIMSSKKRPVDQDSENSAVNFDEDIMLNCTEVQKSASSIKEILESSKSVNETSDADKLATKTFDDSDVAYERDKRKSVNFAEDVVVSNFVTLTPNRKRHHEVESEPCTSAKQRKDDCSKTGLEKDKEETWDEYFFRPMSENIKAFYNESRGQENFDIRDVQSKMSRDPRLWTILHDDLMPNLLKHRYWNAKCSYCHKHGHQKHNCPEPYRPLRCRMCGTQGHAETRCPQKMCLTCGKKQGTFRKTCESCRMLYCNMCKAVGHKSTECPDLWRRFHQTTETTQINIPDDLSEVMKPADLLYCCNCTKRGHDSSTCNEYRWSQHFPTPAFVSNYTDGPEYEDSVNRNTSEDVIPLTKTKKNKTMVFSKENEDLENCFVIYSYGSFYTKKPIGEEVKRKLSDVQIQSSNITNVLKGCVSPSFLDQLSKIIKFEIKIYYNPNKELMIRMRSAANHGRKILDLFLYWLKLEDEDKHLNMCTDLPWSTAKLTKLVNTKLAELGQNFQDPKHICGQIEQLKMSRITAQDPSTLASTSNKILDLRGKLLILFHKKPRYSDTLKKLRRFVRALNRQPCCEVTISRYLAITVNYNKVFVPRALTDAELQRLFKAYYKETVTQRIKETKKQKKAKKGYPYEMFLQNLQQFNNSLELRRNVDCSSATVTNVEEQIPNTIEEDVQTATENTKDVSESTVECTQSSQSVSEEIDSRNISSNLIVVPVQELSSTDVPSKQSKNDHSSGVSKMKPSEENVEATNSNNEEVKSTEQEETNAVESEVGVSKRKKSKKAKKARLDVENSLEEVSTTSAENKAKEIMNEALEFNLPYMNKAVEEVQKRINDKNLKQEHIDTLQRLINLEKDHRKYVSSFCNYLQ